MKNLSDWRSVRVWEVGVERELRRRHVLWLHGWCIGLLVLALTWFSAYFQFLLAGSHSLALRYLVALGIGYLGYLLILRLWARWLLRSNGKWNGDLSIDFPMPQAPAHETAEIAASAARMTSGGGGDFGGGGASGDFANLGDAGSVAGDVASGALQAAASADEGAVVVVPVVAVFLIGLAMLLGTGALLMLYFGWDVLLTVAVELGFSYVSARTAIRVAREGWLSAAVRLTWKPLLGAALCGVLLGALIDHFIPSAHSLPQAVRQMHAQH